MKITVFRYIEAEIYDYPETIKEIEQLREEIMEGDQQEERIRVQSSRQSDPTATRATRLLMDKRLRRLEEVSHAIKRVYDALLSEKRQLMNGKNARFVFTDPPWNVDYGSDSTHPSWKPRKILNDKMSTEDFGAFLYAAFKAMKEVSEPGCMTYIVMSPQEWGNMMNALRELNYHWSSTIIWSKDQLVLSRKDYHTKYEPIWYGWTDGARLYPLKVRKQSDVWEIPRPKVSEEHPTMKPVALVAKAIENSSRAGDTVLDLFGGSGTTLIAAEQLGRTCHMMELDPKYCDVIIERWENLTGEKAVLINE